MRRKLSCGFLVAVLGIIMAFQIYTQTHQVTSNSRPMTSEDSLVMSFDFPPPSVTLTLNYHSVTMSGLPTHGDPGKPVLPFKLVRVLVPQGKDVESVSVNPSNMIQLTGRFSVDYGKTPLPISANTTMQDKPNEAIYSSETPFPSQLYSQESEQYVRGYKILIVKLHPVTYIPKTGELYYYCKLALNLKLKDTSKVTSYFRGLQEDAELVGSLVDNPNEIATYNIVADAVTRTTSAQTQSYDYVIITNNALNSSFQPLINWKISKGLRAKTVLIEDIMRDPRYNSDGAFGDGTGHPMFNDTQAHIRNFIKDAYLNWGIEYALLGGDDDIIPARGVYDYAENFTDYNIPCDMYYGAVDGSWNQDNDMAFGEAVYHWTGPQNATAGEEADFFSEVYIGRAPVDTPQEAANLVSKTIAYEQSPQAAYLYRMLAVGQTLDDVTQGANGIDTVTEIVSQYTTTRLYDRDGTYSSVAVKNELNSSPHIVNHDGHSNYLRVMDLLSSDIYALSNSQPFLMLSLGCYSAAFDSAVSGTFESVGEHFVCGSHGAFAYVGNTRYGWYCPASHNGPGETYNRAFFSVLSTGTTNLGKALQLSKELEPLFDRWTYFTLTLLGDPESEIVTSLKNPTAHFRTNTDLLTPPHVGGIVNLIGTARRGTASDAVFNNYVIEFGSGINPTTWMTTGISLANDGQSEVVKDLLGTWNIEQVHEGIYSLRLTVNGGGLTGIDRLVVIVDKQAAPVYIRPDGTVDPPTAPVSRNGDTYTLTADIFCDGDGIIIQKDNIIMDGANRIIDGSGARSGRGILLVGRQNVTVKDISVKSKLYGICIEHSSNNTIFRSATESCAFGIWLSNSTGNSIVANNITENYYGIGLLDFSTDNTIVENLVANSTGIYAAGVYLYFSSNNSIYHNIFVENAIQRTSQVYDAGWDCADPGLSAPSVNTWDNGYPSGGNYWSDYKGTDGYAGVYQNEAGSDCVGDQPYIIDADVTTALNNTDRYPFMNAWNHDVAVTKVATSKTAIGTGFNVTINVWIKNEGDYAETFNVTLGATTITYEVVATFADVTLTDGETTVLSYNWNTTNWPLGNYAMSAQTSQVQGEIAIMDNSFIGGIISISVIGDITGREGLPDRRVDMYDISSVAKLFAIKYPDADYDPNFDVNDDGKLDMFDVAIIARHFGDHA